MKAARKLTECDRFSLSVSSFVDGELDAAHAVDLEAHTASCTECNELVATLRATRASLKRVVARRAPDALRARISAAMAEVKAAERMGESMLAEQGSPSAITDAPTTHAALASTEPEASKSAVAATDAGPGHGSGANPPRLIGLRYTLAFAAAAGVAFFVGVRGVKRDEAPANLGVNRAATHAAVPVNSSAKGLASSAAVPSWSLDSVLDDLVAQHAYPLPPETTNPEELRRFEPHVGVPVRRVEFLKPFDGRFKGARLHAMRDRRTALLQYVVMGGHRVTVYVFDPALVPMRGSRLQPRVVQERAVLVGTLKGYSVAATERRGVGYALATDLDDEGSARLVAAATP